MAADTSSFSMDSFKIGMLAVGVVCTFAAMIYLMHMAEEVLKTIEDGSADSLLPAGRAPCGVGLTFVEGDDDVLVVSCVHPGSPAALSGKVRPTRTHAPLAPHCSTPQGVFFLRLDAIRSPPVSAREASTA